jgi:hypothetical protein
MVHECMVHECMAKVYGEGVWRRFMAKVYGEGVWCRSVWRMILCVSKQVLLCESVWYYT